MIQWVQTYVSRRISLGILLVVLFGFDLFAQEADTLGVPPMPKERDMMILDKPDSAYRASRSRPLINDTVRSLEPALVIQDTTALEVKERKALKEGHSARKAVFLALALPGAGQAYNKKYWKMPIVYGAVGGAGYLIYYNIDMYRKYIDLYEEDPSTYERYVKNARRNVELSMITMLGVYALQVVDAYVDANLYYWDVNPDLTVRVAPFVEPSYIPGELPMASFGMRVGLNFK